MFNLPVKRACGHEEVISVNGLDSNMPIEKAIGRILQREERKRCSKCNKGNATDISQAIITIAVWLGVFVIVGALCMVIFRY